MFRRKEKGVKTIKHIKIQKMGVLVADPTQGEHMMGLLSLEEISFSIPNIFLDRRWEVRWKCRHDAKSLLCNLAPD